MDSNDAMTHIAGLDLLSTAIVLLDGDGRVTWANGAAETLLARSRRTLLGATLTRLFDDGRALGALLALAQGTRASCGEQAIALRLRDGHAAPDGGALLLDCSVSPIDAAGTDASHCVVEMRATGAQWKITREARLGEQQAAQQRLLRDLAHEIKNPLGGIRGAAQLLEGELGRATVGEYTRVIIDECDRLRRLVDRLLAPNTPRPFVSTDIHALLDRVAQLLGAEFGSTHALRTDFDVSLPELLCDREQITQVLLNIGRNACQAAAVARAPQVALRSRIARQRVLAGRAQRMALEVAIIDNGEGIAPEHIERIFQPLFTTRSDGSGLGLSIAQTLVAHHHGAIEVDSERGRTEFRVLLPFAPPQVCGNPAPSP